MDQLISRRALLAGGVGLAVSGTALACSSGKQTVRLPNPSPSSDSGLAIVESSVQLLSGVEQRSIVVVVRGGQPSQNDASIEVAFGRSPTQFGPTQSASLHDEGLPTRPYYLTTTRFDRAGVWFARAVVSGQQLVSPPFQVVDPATTKVPVPGRALLRVPTPTTADSRGVSPICTRQPPCPFHQVSLDAALDQHRPIALLFATPKFCQSRTCGPVLDVLVSVAGDFTSTVTFIHAEIYADDQQAPVTGRTSPSVNAFALEGEPFLFLAGRDGIVRTRLDGPFDRAEARQGLTQMA